MENWKSTALGQGPCDSVGVGRLRVRARLLSAPGKPSSQRFQLPAGPFCWPLPARNRESPSQSKDSLGSRVWGGQGPLGGPLYL
jgi:hypothetical protein